MHSVRCVACMYPLIGVPIVTNIMIFLHLIYINAAEEDFSTLVKILEFDLNESLIDVNITILIDELMESNETFVIYLTSGSGVKLSPHAQTEVIIIDDDDLQTKFEDDGKHFDYVAFINACSCIPTGGKCIHHSFA